MRSKQEIVTIADRADRALDAIEALKMLLGYAHDSGTELSYWEAGITQLFEPHIDTLLEANHALRSQMAAAKEANLPIASEATRAGIARGNLIATAANAGMPADDIAAALQVERRHVDLVIRQLKGEVASVPERKAG